MAAPAAGRPPVWHAAVPAAAAAPPGGGALAIPMGPVRPENDAEKPRNIRLCGGAWVLGPHVGFCMLAVVLLVAPAVVMILWVLPTLPTAGFAAGVALLAIPILLLMKTATTDPGILPRRSGEPAMVPPNPQTLWTGYTNAAADSEARKLEAALRDAKPGTDTAPLQQRLDALQTKREARVMLWYCHVCNAYRGPRAKHCWTCMNCVEIFDHHCPYTGTCIGAGNYRFYLWFLTFTNIAAVYCAWAVLWHWVLGSAEAKDDAWGFASNTAMIPSYVLLGYLLLVSFFVTGLTYYHYYLVATGQTTREHRRFVHKQGSPYSRGALRNFFTKFIAVDRGMDCVDALIARALQEYHADAAVSWTAPPAPAKPYVAAAQAHAHAAPSSARAFPNDAGDEEMEIIADT